MRKARFTTTYMLIYRLLNNKGQVVFASPTNF